MKLAYTESYILSWIAIQPSNTFPLREKGILSPPFIGSKQNLISKIISLILQKNVSINAIFAIGLIKSSILLFQKTSLNGCVIIYPIRSPINLLSYGKCNHTYGDGFLISEYLKKFADFSSISYPRKKRKSTSIWTTISSFIITILSLIYFIFRYKKQDLPIDKKNAEEDKALFYHCKTWNLQEIKKIKNHYDVSVNDLLYTIIIKALQKYCNQTIRLSSLSMF